MIESRCDEEKKNDDGGARTDGQQAPCAHQRPAASVRAHQRPAAPCAHQRPAPTAPTPTAADGGSLPRGSWNVPRRVGRCPAVPGTFHLGGSWSLKWWAWRWPAHVPCSHFPFFGCFRRGIFEVPAGRALVRSGLLESRVLTLESKIIESISLYFTSYVLVHF